MPSNFADATASSATHRPVGVVVAAIFLAFVSLGTLLMGVLMAIGAVIIHKSPQAAVATPTMPGAVPPSQAAMVAVSLFMALIILSIGVWGGATVVGLLRVKPWARISVMVIGAGLAILGIFGLIGSISAPLMMKSMALPPNVSADQLHIVFAAMGLSFAAVVLVGAWWVVYFALEGTRRAFAPVRSTAELPGVQRPPTRPAGPVTDFTVAQPLLPAERDEPKS